MVAVYADAARNVPTISCFMLLADAMYCVPTGADPALTVGSVIRANTSVCPYAFLVYTDAPWRVPTGGGIRGRCMQRPYEG